MSPVIFTVPVRSTTVRTVFGLVEDQTNRTYKNHVRMRPIVRSIRIDIQSSESIDTGKLEVLAHTTINYHSVGGVIPAARDYVYF